MNYIIETSQLTKKYGKNIVLKNINMRVSKGQILGIVGPSGSGKTTLIKHIVGIEKPSNGSVFIFGRPFNRSNVSRIGYMGQSDALYEDLTGYENLKFFASLYNLKGVKLKNRIDLLLEMLDLENAKHKKVHHYSGGMKKRLSLATAILHEPDLLILDEPTVGIDPVLRVSIWKQFYKMRNEGKTLIVTTHIMDEVEQCDQAALIRDGEIISFDDVTELRKQTKTGRIEELFFETGEQA